MSEPEDTGGEAAAENPQQQVSVRSIYLKDASFESPNAPAIFRETQQPDIELSLGLNTESHGEGLYEVQLSVTVTSKVEDRTAFLAEVQQVGLFRIQGFDDDHLGAVLGIYCPNIIFPYAREAVSNLVSKGGFPHLILEPVNFERLYTEHLQQQRQQAESGG